MYAVIPPEKAIPIENKMKEMLKLQKQLLSILGQEDAAKYAEIENDKQKLEKQIAEWEQKIANQSKKEKQATCIERNT